MIVAARGDNLNQRRHVHRSPVFLPRDARGLGFVFRVAPSSSFAVTDVRHVIEKHGSIDEAELTSLVGGPRRARVFARDLDTWRATLPFGVEVSTTSGIKIYRRVTAG